LTFILFGFSHLVNVLVNTLQIVPHLVNGIVGVFVVNAIVSPEHLIRAVTRDFHNDGLSRTRLPHVSVERVLQVVKDKTTFHKAAVLDPRIQAGLLQAVSDVGNRFAFI
jgi:hypothetical protein